MTSASTVSHLTDDQLVLLYYREPLEEPGLDGHLAACASCGGRFQALSRVLRAVAQDDESRSAGACCTSHLGP
jgi:hypothetical protein